MTIVVCVPAAVASSVLAGQLLLLLSCCCSCLRIHVTAVDNNDVVYPEVGKNDVIKRSF